jgi:hypothetical protein
MAPFYASVVECLFIEKVSVILLMNSMAIHWIYTYSLNICTRTGNVGPVLLDERKGNEYLRKKVKVQMLI